MSRCWSAESHDNRVSACSIVMSGHSPSKTGISALSPGHPRLFIRLKKSDVDARHLGERIDAVLRTAMSGGDDPEASWPDLIRPSTSFCSSQSKTWMPATGAGMTAVVRHGLPRISPVQSGLRWLTSSQSTCRWGRDRCARPRASCDPDRADSPGRGQRPRVRRRRGRRYCCKLTIRSPLLRA